MESHLKITCPCCGDLLTVDRATGEILAEERPEPKPSKSFEQAMDDVRSGSQRREEIFSQAADRTRRLDDLLEKKFEEARKKAEKDSSRPRSIWDAD